MNNEIKTTTITTKISDSIGKPGGGGAAAGAGGPPPGPAKQTLDNIKNENIRSFLKFISK